MKWFQERVCRISPQLQQSPGRAQDGNGTCRASDAANEATAGAPVRMGVTGAIAALALPGVAGDPAKRCPVCRLYGAAAHVQGCKHGPVELQACGLCKATSAVSV